MKLSRKLLSSVIFLAMSSHFLRAASDIIIGGADSDITAAGSNPIIFSDATNNGGTSNLSAGTLIGVAGLATGNTEVRTASAGGSLGTITVTDAIIWANTSSLTLSASSDIQINGAITNNTGSNVGLVLSSTGGSVTLNSDISMTNAGSSLTVTATGVSQPSLTRTLQIGGLASFNVGSGTISLLSNNNFGSLQLTGGTVMVNEASSTQLAGVTASTLTLTSSGAVTDTNGANISVTGLATINAGANAITLGDNGSDSTNFGSLNLTGGAITITEDSGSELAGVSASSLTLTSAGNITDSGTINVTGLAHFSAGSGDITLGGASETTNFSTLRFNTTGAVSIQEDSATSLSGASTGGSLSLSSTAGLSNAVSSSLDITGNASFSGTSITLGAATGDSMLFGSLTFNSAGSVVIQEDSSMTLSGASTAATTSGSLVLTAAGAITDNAGSSLTVGSGTLGITATGASITLDDTAITAGGAATFTAGNGQDIIISNTGNAFAGTVTFSSSGTLNNVSVYDTTAFDIRPLLINGSLTAISGGALTDSGVLSVAGLATLGGSTIDIGGAAESTNFGSLNFNSAGTVAIQEDSATVITGSNSAGGLTLTSAGSVTDLAGTSLSVTNNAAITSGGTTSITLNQTAFNVGGNTTLTADNGRDIDISNVNNSFTGTVTFATASGTLANVNVYDTTAFDLQALTVTNALTAISEGALTDSGNLSVTGLATLGGSSIDIGGAGESTNFGSLNFNGSGAVSIQEDSSTLVTGTNTAGSLILSSTGNITDNTGTSLTVTNGSSMTATGAITLTENLTDVLSIGGNAAFSGTSITLGSAGTANFGSLTFLSGGAVSIQEDSATLLTGTNTGNSLVLSSSGDVTDNSGTSLTVTNGSSITSTGAITLNDNLTDVLSIGGNAAFSGTAITLGSAGTANFGSLTFLSGGAVSIQEDSSTLLTGTNTGNSLVLSSSGDVTDNSGASLTITNGSSITSTGAITLSDNLTDVLSIGGNAAFSGTAITLGSAGTANFGSLTFLSGGAVSIEEDSSTLLTGTNTGDSLILSSAGAITDNSGTSLTVTNGSSITSTGAITLSDNLTDVLSIGGNAAFSGTAITLGSAGTANFGSLTFLSGGAVSIQEDSSTLLTGTNTGNSLVLSSSGDITDNSGTSLTVTNGSSITSTGAITLNDNLTDVLSIGGNAAFSGTAITLGSAGTANFGSLTFLSGGAVSIQEDSSTLLTGTNTGDSLVLSSEGAITDNAGTSLTVANGSSITSTGAITLNDNLTDVLSIGGNAAFSGTAITLGSAGTANFGSLTFLSGGAVSIQEDSSTLLTGTNTGDSLILSSAGAITDSSGTSLTVTNGSSITSTGAITLNDNLSDVLSIGGNAAFSGTAISLGSAGTANFGSLTFLSGGAVSIQEDSATLLTGTNTGDSLVLSSEGAITDSSGTSLTVTNGSSITSTGAITLNDNITDVLSIGGNAAFSGTAITLGSAGTANFGSLTFLSDGEVSIQEDSSMSIVGTNTGDTTSLTSTGGIADSASSSINVGALTLNGTSISLGVGALNTFNATTLNFTSSGAVAIQENSGMDIVGVNTAASADLFSTGALSNEGATSLTITGLGVFEGSSISLGGGIFNTGTLTFNSAGNVAIHEDSSMDIVGSNTGDVTDLISAAAITASATSSINVGALTLDGTSISLGVGASNTFNASTLNFNASGAVSIEENSSMAIVGTNTGGTTLLTSTGAITDTATSSITVGALTLSGASVNLGIGATNTFNASTLNFNSSGAVSITENSGMDIVGANTASSVNLTSQAALSDAGATSINITGQADFTGASISLGGGTFNTGTLTFNSSGSVSIAEDSALNLVGNNSGGATNLSSTGGISDSATSSVNVGALTLSGTSISLGVGAGNTFNASTLNFNSAGSVAITENSNMDIVGVNTAGSTSLSSQNALSDAGATSLTITGLGNFSGASISLGGGIFNSGTISFNSSGAVTIREDSDMDIVGTNTAASVDLYSTGDLSDAGATSLNITGLGVFEGTSISLGGGTFNTGTLTFISAGDVSISEDSSMSLVGSNSAGSLTLSSTAAISDAGVTALNVTGLSSFSGTSVSLGAGDFNTGSLTFNSTGAVTIAEDSNIDIVGVNTGGTTSLTSSAAISDSGATSINVGALTLGGTSISLGAGTFNASSLNFNSAGDVTIAEDSGMAITGVNTAASASLSSTAALTDASATSLDITGLGVFSGASIALGGGVFNTGTLTFNSAGAVTISEDSGMDIVGVNTGGTTSLASVGGISDSGATSIDVGALTLDGTSINLGAGTFNASTLNFNSTGAVTISEDSGMNIVGSNTGGTTSLSSTGAIADAATSTINVGAFTLNGASISLGVGAGNSFNAGTLNFNSAGAVGISENSSMDIVGSNTGGSTSLVSADGIADAVDSSITVGALTLSGTSISLGVGAGNTFNADTVNFNSAGAVTIHEDSAMKIDGANTGDVTKLRSTGAIADSSASSINVGALTLNAASISLGAGAGNTFNASSLNFNSAGGVTIVENSAMKVAGSNTGAATNLFASAGLADSVNSVISTGALALRGTSIQLGVGTGNTLNADTLNFNSTGAVTIEEDSATNIAGASTAGSANLTSVAEITDAGATSLNITGLGSFTGTSISLGSGIFNAGSLTFLSAGNVDISENSGMLIAGTNTGAATNLSATGSITDSATASINTGALTLSGTSINLGNGTGNMLNAATLNFNSAGSVVLHEDSSTQVTGNNTAGSLQLNSTSTLAAGGNVTVTGLASFTGTSITLGGGTSTTHFGSLRVNSAGLVSVQEDSDTSFTGASTASTLKLLSTGTTTFTAGSTLTAANLQLGKQSLVLSGNNLSDTISLALSNGTTLTLNGDDTVGRLTSNGATVAGSGILTVANGVKLNGGAVSGNIRGNTTSTKDIQVSGTLGGGSLNVTGGTLSLSGTSTNTRVVIGANGSILNTSAGLAADASVTNSGLLTIQSAETVSSYVQNGAGILAGNVALTATNGATLSGGQILGYLLGNTRTTGNVLVSGRLGGGRLTVAGGTLTLSGTSNNGIVDVLGASPSSSTGGTLVVSKGGLSSNANLLNAGKLVINANDTVRRYTQNGNGSLAGTGALTAREGATLNGGSVLGSLVGKTTTTGNVRIAGSVQGNSLSVASGRLTLTGTATANTMVNAGATLQGKGIIIGDLTNKGTTSRGFNISGDLVTTGTVSLNIMDRRNFDQIVADTAVLGGKLIVKNTGSGLQSGERVQIIDANVYQNEFTSFVAKGFENGVLFDELTGILVGLGRDIFKSAGSMRDSARKSSSYLNLDKNQSPTYLALFEDAVDIGKQNVVVVGDNVRLISGVTNGDRDLVDALIFATTNTPGQIDADTVNRLSPEVYGSMSDYTKMALQTHARQAVDAAPVAVQGKTQVFATLHSSTAGVDDTASNAGYDIDMNGATAGVRYDLNGNVRIGGLLGADDGSISGALINADSQGMVVGGFGSYQFKDARDTRIHAGLTYGSYEHDSTRRSLFGDVTADGVGSNAFELVLGGSTALYQKDNLRINGSAGFRYMAGEVDSFVENGAGIRLAVDSQDIDAFLLDVGIDLDYKITEKFTVAGRIGYIHGLSGSDTDVSSSFVASGAAGQSFSVTNPGLDDQAFTLGLGLFYDINENARVGVTYRGEFGSDSSPVQTFGIGASFGF